MDGACVTQRGDFSGISTCSARSEPAAEIASLTVLSKGDAGREGRESDKDRQTLHSEMWLPRLILEGTGDADAFLWTIAPDTSRQGLKKPR